MDLNALLTKALDALWGDPDQSRGHAAHLALTSLTPADLLGIIADAVARLPGQRFALSLGIGPEQAALLAGLPGGKKNERGLAEAKIGVLDLYAFESLPEQVKP